MQTLAYAAQSAEQSLAPFTIQRRALRPNDVAIDILYCGVCHSDLHMARNDWGWTRYPVVPGHEIIGRVREVGSAVTRASAPLGSTKRTTTRSDPASLALGSARRRPNRRSRTPNTLTSWPPRPLGRGARAHPPRTQRRRPRSR